MGLERERERESERESVRNQKVQFEETKFMTHEWFLFDEAVVSSILASMIGI